MKKLGLAILFIIAFCISPFSVGYEVEVIREVEIIREVEVVREVEVEVIRIVEVEVVPDTPTFDVDKLEAYSEWDIDCDDIALATWLALEKEGYECFGVIGNLELDGESQGECNHVWVIAEIDGRLYHYENGKGYLLDQQHAEGYRVTKNQMLFFVMDDMELFDD